MVMDITAATLGLVIGGVVLLALGALCWSGPWRRTPWRNWPEREGKIQVPYLPTALFGGLFCLLLGVGIGLPQPSAAADAAYAAGVVAMAATLVFFFWDPPWFGPRWYREFRRAFRSGGSPEWLAEDRFRPGESSVEATHRHMNSGRPIPPTCDVRLLHDHRGARDHRGVLFYWPQAPGFHGKGRPSTDEVIPAEALTGVRKLAPGTGVDGQVRRSGLRSRLLPRLRVDTTEGVWLFETRKASNAAAEIHRRYLDPTTNRYGMPPRHKPDRQDTGDARPAR